VVWPTALAYHFYVSGQLPNAFFYLALLIAAEALDGIGKLGVYVPAEKSLVGPGLFDRIVRLIGGRRNIYVWVLWPALFWPCRKRRSLSWHSGKSQPQPLISCAPAGYVMFSDARGSTDLPLA
jgi:hypothetical protein